MSTLSFAPSNAIVFIEDAAGGEPPRHDSEALVHASTSCVSVGCCPDIDGETEFSLSSVDEPPDGLEMVFEGMIATPSGQVVVTTVLDETLLTAEVPRKSTRIRVWTDHPVWPRRVMVGWS